jgi:enterochelin esterase family protein
MNCARALLVLALGGALTPVTASGAESDAMRSAFLRQWAPRLTAPGADSTGFWETVAARGTPIVERIEGDPRFVHVTFLYRARPETRSVAVISLENHQLANDRYFALAKLARLGSSDAWFRTYRLRADGRFTYRLSVNDERLFADTGEADWNARLGGLTRDPLNRHPTTTRDGDVSLVELPDAPPLRWFEPQPGVPQGRLESAQVGDRARGLDHAIRVYVPHGYSPSGGARNLLLVLDGEGVPSFVPFPAILDNLHAAGTIEPTIAVFVDNRPGKRIHDMWYSDELRDFVRDDLLPWMHAHYTVPRDPRRVAVAGRSASGNTAVYLAFALPSLVGNAISQSGGYALGDPKGPRPGAREAFDGLSEDDFPQQEWLARQIATSPLRPIRLHLEVGTLEHVDWENPFPRYATPSVLLANRHLRDVLDAKGYAFSYREYNGPHDSLIWRGTVGEAIVELLGASRR